jgi:hypothetical protein
MPRHRKSRGRRGGGFFDSDPSDTRTLYQKLTGVAKPPPPTSQVLPTPVQGAVQDGQQMAQNAGRRLKKHFGYDPASGKSMRRLFRTAKGDTMLGGKRRRSRTHRR